MFMPYTLKILTQVDELQIPGVRFYSHAKSAWVKKPNLGEFCRPADSAGQDKPVTLKKKKKSYS